MADDPRKVAFVQHVQNIANSLAELQDDWADVAGLQTAHEWDPGGDNPIVDADITATGITAAQLNSFLSTLRTRFVQLMSGQTVSGIVAGRSVTDAIRSDM